MIGTAVLSPPELPSIGSTGHALGGCKPCAFLHTKGCQNGVLCQFCHLCAPGEKKRRRKEKVTTGPESSAVDAAEVICEAVAQSPDADALSPAAVRQAPYSPMPDTPQEFPVHGDASERIPMAPVHLLGRLQEPLPPQLAQLQQLQQQQLQAQLMQQPRPQLPLPQLTSIPLPPQQPPVIGHRPIQAWALEARMKAEQVRAQQEMWAHSMQKQYLSSMLAAAEPTPQALIFDSAEPPVPEEQSPEKGDAASKDTPVKGSAFDRLVSLVASGACQEASKEEELNEEESYSPQKVSPRKGRRGGRNDENRPPPNQAAMKPAGRVHKRG